MIDVLNYLSTFELSGEEGKQYREIPEEELTRCKDLIVFMNQVKYWKQNPERLGLIKVDDMTILELVSAISIMAEVWPQERDNLATEYMKDMRLSEALGITEYEAYTSPLYNRIVERLYEIAGLEKPDYV